MNKNVDNLYSDLYASRELFTGTSFHMSEWAPNTFYANDRQNIDFVSYKGSLLYCLRNHWSSESNAPDLLTDDNNIAIGIAPNAYWSFIFGGTYHSTEFKNTTPIFKLENKCLFVSYDNLNWENLGIVTGDDGQVGTFRINQKNLIYNNPSGISEDLGVVVGNNGTEGKSAYELWIDAGNSGTETDFLESLKGNPGERGADGQDGVDGLDGLDGKDGKDGKDGISIIWKGSYPSHIINPENGWAYYNTTEKASFVYFEQWYLMSKDGQNGLEGKDGKDGTSIIIKGELKNINELPTPPENASYCYIIDTDLYTWDGDEWHNVGQFRGINGEGFVYIGEGATWDEVANKKGVSLTPNKGWCYRNNIYHKIYVWDGDNWEILIEDGNDGINGTNGLDGLSVFITYHDNNVNETPKIPEGDGTTYGWHHNGTSESKWMSQKVSSNILDGDWSNPIQIQGAKGDQGQDGDKGDAIGTFTVSMYSLENISVESTNWTKYDYINNILYYQESPITILGWNTSLPTGNTIYKIEAIITGIIIDDILINTSNKPITWSNPHKYIDLADMSSFEYLKDTFGENKINNTYAVTLGKVLAVTDNEDNVVAGITNGDPINTNESSTVLPMIFAGATGIQNIDNASFKVFNSGYVEASNINISGGSLIMPYSETSDIAINIGEQFKVFKDGSVIANNLTALGRINAPEQVLTLYKYSNPNGNIISINDDSKIYNVIDFSRFNSNELILYPGEINENSDLWLPTLYNTAPTGLDRQLTGFLSIYRNQFNNALDCYYKLRKYGILKITTYMPITIRWTSTYDEGDISQYHVLSPETDSSVSCYISITSSPEYIIYTTDGNIGSRYGTNEGLDYKILSID